MGKCDFDDWRRNIGYLYASLCALERTLADQPAQVRMITFIGRRDTGIVLEKREEIIWHIQRAIHAIVDSEEEVLRAERGAIAKHADRKAKYAETRQTHHDDEQKR